MWNFQSKRNVLRDRMLAIAPETDPHQFVRRLLSANNARAARSFTTEMKSPRPSVAEPRSASASDGVDQTIA